MFEHPRPRLSFLGLYQFDPTIMDSFHLPKKVDPTLFLPELLTQVGSLNIVYPNINIMRLVLNAWSQQKIPDWERMILALDSEYNPIHNFDRNEEWTDTTKNAKTGTDKTTYKGTVSSAEGGTVQDVNGGAVTVSDTGKDSVSHTGNSDVTNSGTDSTTRAGTRLETNSGNDATTHTGTVSDVANGTEDVTEKTVSFDNGLAPARETHKAPNLRNERTDDLADTTTYGHIIDTTDDFTEAATYGKKETANQNLKDETAYGKTQTTSDNRTATKTLDTTNTETHDRTDETTHGTVDNGEVVHVGHLAGNVGLTTTQSMIADEIELRKKYNIYQIIIDAFKERFCIMVY